MNRQSVKFVGLLILIGLCLALVATFPNHRNKENSNLSMPLQQPTPTPPPTPTPRPNCPVPPYPAAAYGRNPYPVEIAPYFDQVGLNRLGNNGSSLPTMDGQSPYVPCILLKATGYQESGWKHFEAGYNNYGYTEIGGDCDYGLMQIVSGMSGGGGFDAGRANAEIPYNIGTGARTLIQKWNALKLESGGFPGGSYIVGEGDSKVVEDWYYAVWAYNGFVWLNNPNNNCSIIPWSPSACPGEKDPNRPPFDGSQDISRYPYQELIWGYAAHPPTYSGFPIWQDVNLTLPDRAQVGGTQFTYPNKTLPRPTPYHSSCGINYMPIIFKSEGTTPPPPGCQVGKVLIEDGFEGGGSDGPFTPPGTGTDGPWTRAGLDGFPVPIKASLEHLGRPDDDGIKFGGHDNQFPPDDQNDSFDQVIYQPIPMYAGTRRVKVTFDLHMVSDQPTSFPGSYDHFYWGMQTNLGIDNLNERYECNEDRCNPWGQGNSTRWDRYWFKTVILVNVEPAWLQNGAVHVGFWTDVNRDWKTEFYMDNFKVEIDACE